jgi:hypothetical protein
MESVGAGVPSPLLAQVRHFVDAARHRVASAVNADFTLLYWYIGHCISTKLPLAQRGEYGKQLVAALARQLTAELGKGWSEQQLRRYLPLVEVFAGEKIHSTVRKELSCSYRKSSPRCHRAKPCRPSCTSPSLLPIRSWAVTPPHKTLLVAPPAASGAQEKA